MNFTENSELSSQCRNLMEILDLCLIGYPQEQFLPELFNKKQNIMTRKNLREQIFSRLLI